MPVPLLIHLVFFLSSSSARELARQFRRDLNCDPRVPGLRVPTVNLVEADNQLPPANFDLGSAERNVVILFADDAMLFGKPGSGGQPSWSEFAAQVAQLCRAKTNNGAARHRFLPVQLSEASWPLHQDRA